MICIEDYPMIETAIQYAINVLGVGPGCSERSTHEIRMTALTWIDGWIAGKGISEEEAEILRRGVENYIFL